MNTKKSKITTFLWCSQSNLMSKMKWLTKFFYNLISFIINHDSYVMKFLMHYTPFTSLILKRIQLIALVNWVFYVYILQLIVFYFYHLYFHIQYSYYSKYYLLLLLITFSFMLKKVPKISNFSISHCFIFFCESRKISFIFSCSVICFSFSLKRLFTPFIDFSFLKKLSLSYKTFIYKQV